MSYDVWIGVVALIAAAGVVAGFVVGSAQTREQARFERDVHYLLWRVEKLMASQEEFDSVVARLKTDVGAVADKVRGLVDRVAALEAGAGISADSELSVLAELSSVADGLEAIVAPPAPAV